MPKKTPKELIAPTTSATTSIQSNVRPDIHAPCMASRTMPKTSVPPHQDLFQPPPPLEATLFGQGNGPRQGTSRKGNRVQHLVHVPCRPPSVGVQIRTRKHVHAHQNSSGACRHHPHAGTRTLGDASRHENASCLADVGLVALGIKQGRNVICVAHLDLDQPSLTVGVVVHK